MSSSLGSGSGGADEPFGFGESDASMFFFFAVRFLGVVVVLFAMATFAKFFSHVIANPSSSDH
jgi:hypothetical protein